MNVTHFKMSLTFCFLAASIELSLEGGGLHDSGDRTGSRPWTCYPLQPDLFISLAATLMPWGPACLLFGEVSINSGL